MAAIAAEEQEDAFAVRVKGEFTVSPFAGLLTVGFAKAVTARRGREAKKIASLQIFMGARYLSEYEFGLAGW
jgi:hypothetical protein